jgi:hypothetical protein
MSLEGLWNLLNDGRIISTDGYQSFCRMHNVTYTKRDFLFRPGSWRGSLVVPPVRTLLLGNKLVIGHSDFTLEHRHLRLLRLLNHRIRIFATNCISSNEMSVQLPLGVTNYSFESDLHPILGNQDIILEAFSSANHLEEYDGSVFVAMTASTNIAKRSDLLEALRSCSDAKIFEPDYSLNGRRQFLQALAEHSLVPCPEGNGPDTHRLWEALYMGGTPVILTSPFLSNFARLLPIIQIGDWYQLLDRDLMTALWQAAQMKRNNLDWLDINFWNQHILNG